MGANSSASPLGEAVADAAEDPRATWDAIVAQFAAIENASLQLLAGFISGLTKRDAALANAMAATARHEISGSDYDDLMKALLEVHPLAILDELFSGDAKSQRASVRLLNNLLRFHKNVLDTLPDDAVLTWCDGDPAVRYPLAASFVSLFKRPRENKPREWTSLTVKLLEKAPDPLLVPNEIVNRLHPTSWSGSLATKLEGRLKLLEKLPVGDTPAHAGAMAEAKKRLQAQIDAQRRSEQEEDRAESNKFE